MKLTSGKFARALVRSALFGLSLAAAVFSSSLIAQAEGGGGKEMLKQKLEAVKASAAQNQQKLHQYMWTETATATVNGHAMPPKISTAFYGPDGKVHKEPVAGSSEGSAQGQRRGRLMQHMMAEKKAEMKDYAEQVGQLIAMYVPPNPQKMGEAFEAKKASLDLSAGVADLVFRDYAKPGDTMTIAVDGDSHSIRSLNVKSYLDSPQDPVTLAVDFATLADGTHHPSRTVLDAPGKGLQVVTTNSDYRKASQP